eukprot:GHVH01008794.1.p1 GENE.GHVH01008794.1~~GHVH01008794.1.p1  ORF type:complete len:872 (+),score=95.10 GHVH01008794.1:91-2706(+)
MDAEMISVDEPTPSAMPPRWDYRGGIYLGSVSGSAPVFGGQESFVRSDSSLWPAWANSPCLSPSKNGYIILVTQEMILLKKICAHVTRASDHDNEASPDNPEVFPNEATGALPTLSAGLVLPSFAQPGSKKVPWLPRPLSQCIYVTTEWWKVFGNCTPGHIVEETLLDFNLEPKRTPCRFMTDGLRWPPGKSMRDLSSLTTASWRPCPSLNTYGEMVVHLPSVPADWRPYRGLIGSRSAPKIPIQEWITHRKSVYRYQRALRLAKLCMEKPEWGEAARSLLLADELEARQERDFRETFPSPTELEPPKKGTDLLYDIIFEGANGFANGRSSWPVSDKTVAQIVHSGLIEMPAGSDWQDAFTFAFAACSNTSVVISCPGKISLSPLNSPLQGFDDCIGSQTARKAVIHIDLTDLVMQAICCGEPWLFDGLRTGMTTLEDHSIEEPMRSGLAWLSRGELGIDIQLDTVSKNVSMYLPPQRISGLGLEIQDRVAALIRLRGLSVFAQPRVSVSDTIKISDFCSSKLIFVVYSRIVVVWTILSTCDGHWTLQLSHLYTPQIPNDENNNLIALEIGRVYYDDTVGDIKADVIVSQSNGFFVTCSLQFKVMSSEMVRGDIDKGDILMDEFLEKIREFPRFPVYILWSFMHNERTIDSLALPMGCWRLSAIHFIALTTYHNRMDCYLVIIPSMSNLSVCIVSMAGGVLQGSVWDEQYPTVLGEELSVNTSSAVRPNRDELWILVGCYQGGFIQADICIDPNHIKFGDLLRPLYRVRPEAVGRPLVAEPDDEVPQTEGENSEGREGQKVRGFAVEADTLVNSASLTCSVFSQGDHLYVLAASTHRRLLTLSPVTSFTLHQYKIVGMSTARLKKADGSII